MAFESSLGAAFRACALLRFGGTQAWPPNLGSLAYRRQAQRSFPTYFFEKKSLRNYGKRGG